MTYPTRRITPVIERLLRRICITDSGCWEWTGARYLGYGVIGLGRRDAGTALTHRVAYEHMVGAVPEGLDLDHLCRNRACCNPDHLEPVTRIENVRRGDRAPGYAAARTHCKHGHEWTDENTKWTSWGARLCRSCRSTKTSAA